MKYRVLIFSLLFLYFFSFPATTHAVITNPEVIALEKELENINKEIFRYDDNGGNTLSISLQMVQYEAQETPLTPEQNEAAKAHLKARIATLVPVLEKKKEEYAKAHPNKPVPDPYPELPKTEEQKKAEERRAAAIKKEEEARKLDEANKIEAAKKATAGQTSGSGSNPVPGRKKTDCTFSTKNSIYCMLAPIGIFTDNKQLGAVDINPAGLSKFLNNIVKFAIAIASGLAVMMIVLGGVQYASTDAMFGKSEGKARIQQALSGLLLAILSYAILNTINPDVFSTSLNLKTPRGYDPNTFTVSYIQEVESGEAGHEHDEPITNPIGEFIPPPGTDLSPFPGIQDYMREGRSFKATDNSNNTGAITYQVAYLRDSVPSRWPNLQAISTYRSAEHNKKIGGSATSDHLRGAAIDFASVNSNEKNPAFIRDGYSLLEYIKQNGHRIGADQVIFRDQNWRYQGNKWVQGGAVSEHYNHVHIGFQ